MRPDWMRVAWGEIGVEEVPGPSSNPRILEYHASCDDQPSTDAVPWCSSFVNWCMMKVGRDRTRSRAARSWQGWGVGIADPIPGAVVVLWRIAPDSWQGHVGFYVDELEDEILMLGGNQNDAVSIRRYPKIRVLGYRWTTA